jgi:hypothetical protein
MKSIKKLRLENENSFRIIESGLSTNQLSRLELSSLIGGVYNYVQDCSFFCPRDCFSNGCPLDL